MIHLSDSSLLQAFAQGLDGFYYASLHPLIKDWIRLRPDKSAGQENTCVAVMLVGEIVANSWQKQHFDLSLLTKQDIASHIIALEESYQEFFISQPYIPLHQRFLTNIQSRSLGLLEFLRHTGSYHLSEIINQRLNAQNQNVLGFEHPDTLTSMANLASTYQNQGRLWLHRPRARGVVMTTSMLLGWWICGC